LGVSLVIVAVVLLLVLKDDGESDNGEKRGAAQGVPGHSPAQPSEKSDKPTIPTIVVKGGEPAEGILSLSFGEGEQIRFRVRSDRSEEVHVHGYDIAKDVPAGGQASFDFAAEIEGIFEVELENTGTQIAELEVTP